MSERYTFAKLKNNAENKRSYNNYNQDVNIWQYPPPPQFIFCKLMKMLKISKRNEFNQPNQAQVSLVERGQGDIA